MAKRFHVHVGVEDLDTAKRFYSALFGAEPVFEKPDYVKWALEDPRINFAISLRRDGKPGLDHIGLQTDEAGELDALAGQLKAAEIAATPEPDAQCCYAHSDKHWVEDPAGLVWEIFHTMDQAQTYRNGPETSPLVASDADETPKLPAGCC